MDDDELIKEIPKNEEEDIKKTLSTEEPMSFQKKIIIGILAGILLFIITLIIILLSVRDENKSKTEKEYGILKCEYYIQTIKSVTQIISKEFNNIEGINIYIKGNKINFVKEYQFDSFGGIEVNITVPENIDMKSMFKDVETLRSITLFSERNCKIISLESTFENCKSLRSINIIGFDTSQIRSLKKAFYGTSLEDLTKIDINVRNVEDMSYMFSNSELKEIDLSGFDTSNAKDISYMFSGCSSLHSLNLSNFSTEKIAKMSYLFN
jgi:surface protein